jgi:hypothetical protein
LRTLIGASRQKLLREANAVQVQTYWQIGRHIVEFEQGGKARAAYGKRLLPQLGTALAAEFGKGFDASDLRYMRLFYNAVPMPAAHQHRDAGFLYRPGSTTTCSNASC